MCGEERKQANAGYDKSSRRDVMAIQRDYEDVEERLERETRLELRPQPGKRGPCSLPTGRGSDGTEKLDSCTWGEIEFGRVRREIERETRLELATPDLGKVVLYQLSYSGNRMSSASDWSGKRD